MPNAETASRPAWLPSRRKAAQIALTYAVAGVVWILVSDHLLHAVCLDQDRQGRGATTS